MPYSEKLKLAGAEWGSKPSKRYYETHPEQINGEGEERERRKGSPPKRNKVSRIEEKKFRKIVAKQAKSHYYNPDPWFRLIGEANETDVILNGTTLKALVDSGSQISRIPESVVKLLGLKVKSLKNILGIEGTKGIKVKYRGYVEAILGLSQVKDFEEPCLFVVVNDINRI